MSNSKFRPALLATGACACKAAAIGSLALPALAGGMAVLALLGLVVIANGVEETKPVAVAQELPPIQTFQGRNSTTVVSASVPESDVNDHGEKSLQEFRYLLKGLKQANHEFVQSMQGLKVDQNNKAEYDFLIALMNCTQLYFLIHKHSDLMARRVTFRNKFRFACSAETAELKLTVLADNLISLTQHRPPFKTDFIKREIIAPLQKYIDCNVFFKMAVACRTPNDSCEYIHELATMTLVSMQTVVNPAHVASLPTGFWTTCMRLVDNYLREQGKKVVVEQATRVARMAFRALLAA